MKELNIPDNFDGQKYFDAQGDYPQSHKPGYLLVPDEITQDDINSYVKTLDEFKREKIDRLWLKATAYEYSYVANGGYSALLELKLAGSSKAASFGDWIKTIWTEYYARRDQVTASHSQEIIDLINEDFSTVGPPPYLIREVLFGE